MAHPVDEAIQMLNNAWNERDRIVKERDMLRRLLLDAYNDKPGWATETRDYFININVMQEK